MTRPSLAQRVRSLFTPDVGAVDVVAPAPRAARRDLAIVVIVRNAAARLGEWIDFHLRAGVDHIFLYDDLSTDDTATVLAPHVAAGRMTVVPWHVDVTDASSGRWMSQQILAYAHAVQTFGAAWRHMAFIDDDEFLVPTGPEDLRAVLARLGHPSNLSLPWHMFGSDGHATPPPGSTVANYTRRAVFALDKLVLNFKCIVDPTKVTRVSVHAFETTDLGARSMNTAGRLADEAGRRSHAYLTSEAIQLNHYFTRSRAELMDKIERGSVNGRSYDAHRRRVLERADAIERDTVIDRAAIDFLARTAPGAGEAPRAG